MAKGAIEYEFKGASALIANYDSTKINVGSLIKVYSGASATDCYAGPSRIGLARPMEASTQIPGIYPHVLTYSSTIDWVFLADTATASATRRIIWYEFNKNTSVFTWKGFITLTYPTATAHTIRGFRMTRDLYTVGTLGVTGTTVNGVGSAWSASRLCVGSRIGFGSTDPTAITTWYQISAINSDTSITLVAPVPSPIAAGASYVIEDLRCLTTTTNATAANGGLFVAKGLRIEDFAIAGTVIPAAITTDNIKAVYWLADAATVLNTAACGLAREDKTSWTNQDVYVLDTATVRVYKYNVRAALAGLSAGKSTSAYVFRTGNQAVTGTMSQSNNGRIGVLNHGPGNGVNSLYFATTTRVYRAAISNIISGSTSWQSDAMLEIPPGGTSTFTAGAGLSSVEIADTIDRLIVLTTGAAGIRSYVTKYNTNSDPFDHIFLLDTKQIDQSTADSGTIPHPTINAIPFSVWSENGLAYFARVSSVATGNHVYSVPLGAHWTYSTTTNQVLISPAINTSSASKLYKIYVNSITDVGSDEFSIAPEPFRVFARTSGISDNSGGWTEIGDNGNLSALSPSSQIQFKFHFKTIGGYCVPSRIMGFSVIYEDTTTDSHYEPSVANSSIADNRFAYRQTTLWNSAIPNMRIRLYNAVTGALILDDNVTSSAFGTFQYSSNNGSSWNTWSSGADVVGNYIRYTATSLPAATRIRALLTQA